MKATFPFAALLLASAAGSAVAQSTPSNVYLNTVLVSNVKSGNAVVDPNLVDPWGISFSAASPFWVSNHFSGTSTLYNGSGAITPTVVRVPAAAGSTAQGRPTGQVNNGNTTNFLIAGGSASFIFATEDGTISGWRGGAVSEVKVDNSASKAVYKGLAIGNSAGGPTLYAANFRTGKIDAFNGQWAPAALTGTFTDAKVPAGFAPFNIWNLGGTLYVLYAKQDADKFLDVAGAGNGYVSTFDLNGNLKAHLIEGGVLNSPWGVAIAPANWGAFGGALLIGNFGDGRIYGYNATTGALIGQLQGENGSPIIIPGLWALVFGNGGRGGDVNTLYYAGGMPNGSTLPRGVLGSLAPPAAITSVSNAASSVAGPIAPGEIILINGQTVGPSPLVSNPTLGATAPLGSTLGGTSVSINAIAAPMVFANGNQTSVQVPYGVAGSATANIVLKIGTQTTAAFSVPVAPTAPGIFTLNFSGKGGAVALNSDGTVNSATNPAARGTSLMIYATGEGVTNPAGVDGAVQKDKTRVPVAPVAVTFNGIPATVNSASGTPNDVAGVLDIDVTIPKNITPGASDLALTIGGVSAQTGVSVFVK